MVNCSSGISTGPGTGRLLLVTVPRDVGGTRATRATCGTPPVLRLLPVVGSYSAQLVAVAFPVRVPVAAYPARGAAFVRDGAQVAPLRRRVQRVQRRGRCRCRQVAHETGQSPTSAHAQTRNSFIFMTLFNYLFIYFFLPTVALIHHHTNVSSSKVISRRTTSGYLGRWRRCARTIVDKLPSQQTCVFESVKSNSARQE